MTSTCSKIMAYTAGSHELHVVPHVLIIGCDLSGSNSYISNWFVDTTTAKLMSSKFGFQKF